MRVTLRLRMFLKLGLLHDVSKFQKAKPSLSHLNMLLRSGCLDVQEGLSPDKCQSCTYDYDSFVNRLESIAESDIRRDIHASTLTHVRKDRDRLRACITMVALYPRA